MQSGIPGQQQQFGTPPQDQFGAPQQQQYGVPPQQIVMGTPTMGQPAVGMGGGFPTTNATLALVLAIVSIFFGNICLAIPAWIVANGALAITNSYPGHPEAGKAKAAKVIAIIVTVLSLLGVVLMGILLVWASSLAANSGGFQYSTFSQFTADDHMDSLTASSDNIMTMKLSDGDDLNWGFTTITLYVGDNSYSCSTSEGNDCLITQNSGFSDSTWESGETVVISEDIAEICSNECEIEMSVQYMGTQIFGPNLVQVA
jgi:hypothetical protein